MDQLTLDSTAALKAGMSYGKYMASRYVPPVIEVPVQQKRLCRYCGKEIKGHGNRKYCDDRCMYECHKKIQLQYYYRKIGIEIEVGDL